MNALLRRYIGIALLRDSPANLPHGSTAMAVAVLFAMASYVTVGGLDGAWSEALSRSVLDLALNAALIAITLSVFGRTERFSQAYSAVCGSGAIVNLAALPLMWRLAQLPDGVEPGGGYILPWVLLMCWLVAVQAHVLRLTLSIGRGLSIGIALAYLVVAFTVFDAVYSTGS